MSWITLLFWLFLFIVAVRWLYAEDINKRR